MDSHLFFVAAIFYYKFRESSSLSYIKEHFWFFPKMRFWFTTLLLFCAVFAEDIPDEYITASDVAELREVGKIF